MDLKDIASISGKSGLYKVVKPTRTGVILETIDAQKAKIIANANNRVSLLKEISVYTTGSESSTPLENIFEKIHDIFGGKLSVDAKSDNRELTAFIEQVAPDYDREKVYLSDIKKIATWYTTLVTYFPERFVKETTSSEKTEAVAESAESSSEPAAAKKPKAKKAPAKKKTE